LTHPIYKFQICYSVFQKQIRVCCNLEIDSDLYKFSILQKYTNYDSQIYQHSYENFSTKNILEKKLLKKYLQGNIFM
jgi:hypothetical protein